MAPRNRASARSDPDSTPEIFSTLGKKIQQDEDLFDYFRGLRTKQAGKGLVGYFELKPGAFGISIDVKAMLQDLGESIQRKLRGK